MTLLKELTDDQYSKERSKERTASRAVLFDRDNLIPLLFVSKHNYHKLPGGGIDQGENNIDALKREAREETGCEIEITGEVGQIIEYRSAARFNWESDLHQTSYCYLGKIITKGQPRLEEGEIAEGFQLVWMTLDDAIEKLTLDAPDNFEGSFIRERDLAFLKEAKSIIQKN